jgi:AraC-like DNA-binding protein
MNVDIPPPRTGQAPPVPALRSSGIWDQREHLLLAVLRGAAAMIVDEQADFRLSEGEGGWIPMRLGDRWTIVTEPGTVALPLLARPEGAVEPPVTPTRFRVSEEWRDWLIQHFVLTNTPLASSGFSPDVLSDLLQGPGPRRRSADGPPSLRTFEPLVLPVAHGARQVADALLRNPAIDNTIEQWATRVLSSSRTLLRDFRADTGLTFEQWRLRCRLNAAVEILATGGEAAHLAVRVGFSTNNGLTRAFKQQFGLTPHGFSRSVSRRPRGTGPSHREAAAHQASALMNIIGAEGGVPAPPLLPEARTPPRTNNLHVLIWTYRGSGYLDVGERRYEQGRGNATWIPADIEHITGVRENSISLRLGSVDRDELLLAEPLQAQFPPAWDDYLLFCSVSASTPLRPADYDPRHILTLFTDQLAAQRALSVPMPIDPDARAMALEYLRVIGTAHMPAISPTADIHRAFRDQTGMSIARWRYAARMRLARQLLIAGAKPSAIARRVGYAHLPTFSAAFTRFHGLSPRDYREREMGG